MSHLHDFHGLNDRFLHASGSTTPLSCSIGDCTKKYSVFNSFRNHVRKHYESMCDGGNDTDRWDHGTDDVSVNTNCFDCGTDDVDVYTSEAYYGGSGTVDSCSFGDTVDPDVEFEIENSFSDCDPDDEISQAQQHSNRDARTLAAMKELFDLKQRSKFTKEKFFDILLRYRLNSTARTVTLASVAYNYSSLVVVFEGLFTVLKDSMPDDSADRAWLEKAIAECMEVFTELSSQHKMMSYLTKHELFVPPQTIFLGPRWDQGTDRDSGTATQTEQMNSLQYISIRETLKFILKFPEVYEMLNYEKPSQDGLLRTFRDGSYCKSHPFLIINVNGLLMKLFYDEFGNGNPLGSKAGYHKLGAVYWVLDNLPTALRSGLSCCFVALLFYHLDLKKYEFNQIIKPLVDEIKQLQSEGVKVVVNYPGGPKEVVLKGTLSQVCGDNLGINQLFNMIACFGKNTHFCRFCEINQDDIANHFREVPDKLRTVDSYEHCLNMVVDPAWKRQKENRQKNNYKGVKGDCLLNTIDNFHVTQNYIVSMMHDFYHGFAENLICFVLEDLIHEKVFSLDELNSMVSHFDFGFEEARNKPSEFSKAPGSSVSIRVTFAECSCLLRLLPQMVGPKVPEGHSSWAILLKLLDCYQTIFAPIISPDMIDQLEEDIADFLFLFKRQYPHPDPEKTNFIPKLHFLTHYPAAIRKVGPLVHFSEIRFEAKHQSMKPLGGICCNYKNICYTYATRHQLSLACAWLDGPPWYVGVSCITKEKRLTVAETEHSEVLTPVLDAKTELRTGNVIVFRGVSYRKGLVLVCGMNGNLPIFHRIKCVYAPDSLRLIFVCHAVRILSFNRHLYAFKVTETDEKVLLRSDHDHYDYHPISMRHNGFNSDRWVSTRHAATPEGVCGMQQ